MGTQLRKLSNATEWIECEHLHIAPYTVCSSNHKSIWDKSASAKMKKTSPTKIFLQWYLPWPWVRYGLLSIHYVCRGEYTPTLYNTQRMESWKNHTYRVTTSNFTVGPLHPAVCLRSPSINFIFTEPWRALFLCGFNCKLPRLTLFVILKLSSVTE